MGLKVKHVQLVVLLGVIPVLCGCTSKGTLATYGYEPLDARSVAVEANDHCAEMQAPVMKALASHGIAIAADAPVILDLACSSRPGALTVVENTPAPAGKKYSSNFPRISEAVIVAYDREGKALTVATAAAGHKQDENVADPLAEAVVARLFGSSLQ
ncbi:MAG: hypothetical protein ACK5NN_10250 [Sphingomonadaceae bacterium]